MNEAETKIDPDATVTLDITYPQARLMLLAGGMYLAAMQQGADMEPLARDIVPAMQDIVAFTSRESQYDPERAHERQSMTFSLSQMAQIANVLAFMRANQPRIENDTGDAINNDTIDQLGEYICERARNVIEAA